MTVIQNHRYPIWLSKYHNFSTKLFSKYSLSQHFFLTLPLKLRCAWQHKCFRLDQIFRFHSCLCLSCFVWRRSSSLSSLFLFSPLFSRCSVMDWLILIIFIIIFTRLPSVRHGSMQLRFIHLLPPSAQPSSSSHPTSVHPPHPQFSSSLFPVENVWTPSPGLTQMCVCV